MPPPIRSFSGTEFRELSIAILKAIPDRHSFALVVRDGLDLPLDHVTSGTGSFQQVVFDVLRWAQAQGRTEELIRALLVQRPHNPDLRAIAARLDLIGSYPGPTVPRVPALDKPATFMDRESWYARRAAFELTVCRVYDAEPEGEPLAAGLLVATDLVLTCGSDLHASDLHAKLQIARARFNTGVDDQGRPVGTTDIPFGEKSLVATGPFGNMNYYLLRLSRNLGEDCVDGPIPQTRGWLYLDPNRTASAGDGTYMIRHAPEGQLHFVYRDDSIEFADVRLVRHRHEPSALAGTPIVTKDWAVVALHCRGDEAGRDSGIQIQGILDDIGRRGEIPTFKTSFQGS